MGVKNLWDILESCKQTLPLHHLQNKRLCVDLSCWLIQFQTACRTPACSKEKIYLKNLFHRLRALIALNCSLVFVADGSIPSIKLSTYRRRLGSASEAAREEANPQMVPALRRNMGSEFSCMIKEAKGLGLALGIPCLDGLEEAEAQCALLNSAALCDGCFTADSDIFLFGARTVYRDILLGEGGGYVICYEMVDIEKKLGYGRNSLITLALLLGSDYSQGVRGFGPETACQLVKSIRDETILNQIASENLIVPRRIKGTKKTGKVLNCDKDNVLSRQENVNGDVQNSRSDEFLQVINAYLKPKCHSADSDTVLRVCIQHPFQRRQLQQICEEAFGWTPDITDKYILPKIAERDLRRFANLRSMSSKLGVRVPLHEIPVDCPVATIIKQRKVQGRDCFEVSWREMNGLQTSIVPADLIERACPEKIAEFMEKKDEGKKQKRVSRPRKPTKANLKEADAHVQGLLLNTESQSNSTQSSTTLCLPADDLDALRSEFSRNNSTQNSTTLILPVNLEALTSEFIDLCSPSPPLRACKVAKNQRSTTDLHVNVIDLCDSETDPSPSHQRKARELRSFIDGIRRDLY